MSQGSNMFLVNDLSEVTSADLVELGDHVIHDLFMVCGSRSEFSKVAPQLSKQDDSSPDISVQRDVVQRCWKLVVESGGAIKAPLPSDVRTALRDVRLTRMLSHALATGAISLPSTTTTSSTKSTTNTSSSSSSSSTSSSGGFGAPNVKQEPNADSSHVSSQHDASTSSVGLAPGVVSTIVRLSSDSDRGRALLPSRPTATNRRWRRASMSRTTIFIFLLCARSRFRAMVGPRFDSSLRKSIERS